MTQIILASGSPRRKELFSYLGIDFKVIAPDIDETVFKDEKPFNLVLRLSAIKAQSVSKLNPGCTVIAADTVVSCGGEILGKPKDRDDALGMLLKLSGKTHQVYTGFTVCKDNTLRSEVISSQVSFAKIDRALLAILLDSGEYKDKAGAYALQGVSSIFIRGVSGSVSSVIGLPLCELREVLKEFNISPRAYKSSIPTPNF